MKKKLQKLNCLWILIVMLSIFCTKSYSQFVIAYPAPAQSISASFGASTLAVRVDVLASSSNGKVTVNLPIGVSYVAGSLSATVGTATIAESNVSNLNAPVFSLNAGGAITAGEYVTFTIQRKTSGCGAYSYVVGGGVMKDVIVANSAAGTTTENNINTNSYNLLYPSFGLTPPTAVTGAVVGGNYTRSFTIANGGTGCADTVRMYIVYPSAGLQQTSLTILPIGGGATVALTASSVNGDTSFYKITGNTLGADNMFCNGESLVFTETVKVLKCNTTTTYNTGWSDRQLPANSWCQTANGTSSMTMAVGVAVPSASGIVLQTLGTCRSGVYSINFTNNGSGSTQGAMYNFVAAVGLAANYGGATNPVIGIGGSTQIDSIKFSSQSNSNLITTVSGSATSNPYNVAMGQFTTDPDGTSVGLEDLDGDGQYDDLAPGKSFTLIIYRSTIDNQSCPANSNSYGVTSKVKYNTACDPTTLTTVNLVFSVLDQVYISVNSFNVIGQSQILGGTPFALTFCTVNNASIYSYRPTDSLYLKVALPVGVALSGTTGGASRNGTAIIASDVIILPSLSGVDTLLLRVKGWPGSNCFDVNFVYNCGNSQSLNFNVKEYYISDKSCNKIINIGCTNKIIPAICSSPCSFIDNQPPTVERTTLGFTDVTLNSRVNSSLVTGRALSTFLPLDSILLKASAIVYSTYNNLYYQFTINKASNQNIVTIADGTFYHKSGSVITNCPLPTAYDSSTSTYQNYIWNISSCLQAGTINPNDSVWVILNMVTTNANNDYLYSEQLTLADVTSKFFSVNTSNVREFCNTWKPNMYFNGIWKYIESNHNLSVSGCNTFTDYTASYMRHINSFDIFPNEYRPIFQLDSVYFTLPNGYQLDATYTPFIQSRYYANSLSVNSYPNEQGYISPNYSGNNAMIIFPNSLKTSDFTNTFDAEYWRYIANCKAAIGSTTGTAKYYFSLYKYTGQPQPFIYTGNVGPFINTGNFSPNLSIQNNTGMVQGIQTQHTWDVQINSIGTVTAPYVWLALEKTSGTGILIDSVVLTPSNVKLTPSSYGSGSSWYQVNAAGLASGTSQLARVYFKYTNCTADSIIAKIGWNCTGYPSPDPSSYTCTASQTALKIIPQPSEIQMTLDVEPNGAITSCTPAYYELTLNSAQTAFVDSVRFTMALPAGLNLSSPVEFQYPAGTGVWTAITNTGTTSNHSYKINSTTYGSAFSNSGIPGTASSSAISPRQVKIRFSVQNDCSFRPNSTIQFNVFGKQPCQSQAIGSGVAVTSTGITLVGVSTPYYTANTAVPPATIVGCSTPGTLGLSTTIVAGTTGNADTVFVTLPAGTQYIVNSFACSSVTCPSFVNSTIQNNGTTIVKIKIPSGATSGTIMTYSVGINAIGNVCGNLPVTIEAVATVPGPVCGAFTCPGIGTLTGSITTSVNVSKPVISFSSLTKACNVAGNNTVNVAGKIIVNNVAVPIGSSINVKYYCANASGQATGNSIGNGVLTGAIAVGDSASFTATLNGASCTLTNGLVIKAAANDCACDSVNLLVPVTIVNAGTISGSSNICMQSIATLTSTTSGGVWSNNNTAVATIDPVIGTIIPIAVGSSIISYTVTTANGCSDIKTHNITVSGSANAGSNQTVVCYLTSTATMNATGTGTWTAVTGNPGTATIATPTSPTTDISNFSAAGVYTFKWTNTAGCSNAVTVTVGNTCCRAGNTAPLVKP